MKKLISLILLFAIIISSFTITAFAETNVDKATLVLDGENHIIEKVDIATGYIINVYNEQSMLIQSSEFDTETGNIIEKVIDENKWSSARMASEPAYNKQMLNISDFIIDTNVIEPEQDINNDIDNITLIENIQDINSGISLLASIPSYNYLYNEPLFDDGLSSWTDGYKYIGKGSYIGYEAYLFRLQSISLSSAHRLTFGANTAVSTIIGTILGVVTGGWAGLTVAIVSSLVAAILTDSITAYTINPEIGVKTLHNSYRTRVGNSYALHYSFCRNEDYWYIQNWDTQKQKYVEGHEYRRYNHGLSVGNYDAIMLAIDNYYLGIVVNRPCI